MLQLVILCWPLLCHSAFFSFNVLVCVCISFSSLCFAVLQPSVAPQTHLTQSKPHIQITPFAPQLALTYSHIRTHAHAQRVRWWLTWVWLCAMFSWQASIWRGPPVVLRPTNPFQSTSHHLVLSSPLLSLQAMQPPVLIIRNRPQFDAQNG